VTGPRHHPDPALLLDFATGGLRHGPRLVVGAHLGVCDRCRREVEAAEQVGGALLEALAAAEMQGDALALALARIERPAPVDPLRDAPPRHDWIRTPPAVLDAMAKRRRWAAPGVWVAPVARGPGPARVYLLGVSAGMSVPLHSHRGEEMLLVLKGGFADRGADFEPGDFAQNGESVEHRPRITDQGECVCLVAADGPLAPRDWVGRLFQPLVRI
jgi:putative transcriptional regulator